MLVHLSTTIPVDTPRLDGVLMGVNYGLNKVRFINPFPQAPEYVQLRKQ